MPYVGGQEKCRMGTLKPAEINALYARWKRPGAGISGDYVDVGEEMIWAEINFSGFQRGDGLLSLPRQADE